MSTILRYDIALVPKGWAVEDVIKVYKEEKVVLYDTSNVGTLVEIPSVTDKEAEKTIDFIDLSQ